MLGAPIPPSHFSLSWAFQSHDMTTIQAFMAHSAESTKTNILFVCDTEKESESEEGLSCKTATHRFD